MSRVDGINKIYLVSNTKQEFIIKNTLFYTFNSKFPCRMKKSITIFLPVLLFILAFIIKNNF